MKKLLLAAVCAFAVQSSFAEDLALWTFETTSNSITGPGPTLGPIPADVGSGSAFGIHALGSATGTWSHPVGNGSPSSFSANTWSTGDCFQFQVSTIGYMDLIVSYDQTRSSGGPTTFTFSYGTDGVNFSPFLVDYAVLNNATNTSPPTTPWGSTPLRQSAYTFAHDLSAIATVENAATVYFRIIDDSPTGAVSGTSRIDNFLVSATLIPEPSALALIGVAASALIVRRFRRR
jgi:hypothetical protein